MLYEIDESCIVILATKEPNVIAFFEQLALDRRKSKNVIIAKRTVLHELSKCDELSEISRGVYKALQYRMSEYKLLLNSTKKYCRVVGFDETEDIVFEDNHEIIILNINYASIKDFTARSIMLAENEDDIEFYRIMGQYYVEIKKIGNIKIGFEEKNGGGSTISTVLRHTILEDNRMCLCIVDSDRKYLDASPGETMKKIQEVISCNSQIHFEVLLLEMHEIENLIPFAILERVIEEYRIDGKGLDFLKFLLSYDHNSNSPIFFFDLKKGIVKSTFILDEPTSEKEKKFRKKECYRQYWIKYLEEYGIEINKESESVLIPGICERILRYSLVILEQMKEEKKLNSLEIDEPIQSVWLTIGEKVYNWGCVGGRLAV